MQDLAFFDNVLSEEELIANNIPQEQWLQITDFIVPNVQPYYWISTYGNVFSTFSNRYLYQSKSSTNGGHMNVILSLKDGSIKHIDVHRLVMLAFRYFPGCEKYIVNHIDTIPDHNWLWNLEWVTQSYNVKYSYECGNMPRGENKSNATLNDDKVHLICKLLCMNMSYKDILYLIGYDVNNMNKSEYHNAECLINNIKYSKAWNHISSQYDINTNKKSIQRFTEDQVKLICECIVEGMQFSEIIKKLDINTLSMDKKDIANLRSIISAIKTKRVYKYISDKYF